MSQTQVPAGSALARKLYSVALFAQTQKAPGFARNMTGSAPTQGDAEAKLKGQTSPDMPIVRVTDLSKTAGEAVSVDMFGPIGGKPIMGDRNAEGRGEKLTSSSMDIAIDLTTKVVDAGGKMAQQRTVHQLRGIAQANLVSWFARFEDQSSLVHMAGARGSVNSQEWVVPLQSDSEFSEIMVNAVKAPTYNRHYVADGLNLAQGGAQLGSIDSTDIFKLEHLDALRTLLDEMDYPLQPVKVADDPAAADEPMWVYYATPRQYAALLANTTGNVLRTFQQNAWNRASYGSKHPLFKGEVGMWNGILVKKMARAVRFLPSDITKIVTAANAASATESDQAINAGLGAGYAVDRGLLLGAQALGNCFGRHKSSDYYFSWFERLYNFERNLEVAGDVMGGKAKLRFTYDEQGVQTVTDHGVLVLDTTVKL